MDIYKSLDISIGTVMKNLEIWTFVPDHLKTKKMYKHAVKTLPDLLRYVPDEYKTQQIGDKAILAILFLTATKIKKIDVFCICFFFWLI